MKVFEILYKHEIAISEEDVANRLKSFDWQYEFSPDLSKIAIGNKQLELLENMVYQIWKKDPVKAVTLWYANTPVGTSDASVVPSFILRLAAQDNVILPEQTI